jgi:hypothetical protein
LGDVAWLNDLFPDIDKLTMDTAQLFEQVNEVVESLFSGGSRYQVEKVATVAVYAIVSAASLVWAFSGDGAANELHAEFEVGRLNEIDDQNLHLINSGDEWTTVRVVLNQMYLWTTPKVEAREQITLQPADFSYYYYIPRPWGRQGWELLAAEEKPGPRAPGTLMIERVRIWAREGNSNIILGPDGKAISESMPEAKTEVAGAERGAAAPPAQ